MSYGEIIRSQKLETGIITLDMDFGEGGEQKVRYAAIRIGLSWPTAKSPGFYIVLGERWTEERSKGSRGKLVLLREYEYPGLSLDAFFDHLTDDMMLCCADAIYAEIEREGYTPFQESFWKFCDRLRVRYNLRQAPFAKDAYVGLALIQDWRRLGILEIREGSVVHGQLKQITRDDLNQTGEDSFETRFYAVNALRFAIGSFHKYPPRQPVIPRPRGRVFPSEGGWMMG